MARSEQSMKSRQRGLNKPPGGLEEPWERSQQRFFKKWIDNPDRTDAEIYAEIDKEDEPISRRVIRGRDMKILWEDLLDMYDFDDCVLCPVEEPEKITKEVET